MKLTTFIIGSKESGKTRIANYICNVHQSLSSDYLPTQGVRILELERKMGKQNIANIELWDLSSKIK